MAGPSLFVFGIYDVEGTREKSRKVLLEIQPAQNTSNLLCYLISFSQTERYLGSR